MTARDKLGSITSPQGGDEAIPREYHRKVLKKIAQLTKVQLTNYLSSLLSRALVQALAVCAANVQ